MTHIISGTLAQTWALGAMRHSARRVASTANASCLFCRLFCLVLGQAFLQIGWRLEFWFLGYSCSPHGSEVACCSSALCFGLGELLEDALIVTLGDIVRDTLHAKYLHI